MERENRMQLRQLLHPIKDFLWVDLMISFDLLYKIRNPN